MPTLNDILTANGDYAPVSGYPVDDKYENDSPVINVYDRTIGEIVGDTSTSGENVSQYLTFRIPRHPDHYDLIENGTNIRILYRLEDDTGEDVVPVNVVANEDYIIFGWKIPLVVTVNPGVVTFIIHAYKSENNIITYHYKTLPKTYMILETMETDVVVPEIEMYNLAEAYARGTITDVFGQTRPVEEGDPGYHDNSKYYKELAGTSKIDAETAKNAAEAAQKAAETAQKASEDARDQAVAIVGGEYVSYGQTQSLNDTQKNKARENIGATGPNGYYPNMTVGLSENFVGTGEPTRRIFNYDTAGGSADISDGNAEIDKIVGGTVAWNQQLKLDKVKNINGITASLNNDRSITINGTATSDAYIQIDSRYSFKLNENHKYLYKGCASGGSSTRYFLGDGWSGMGRDYGSGTIFTATSGTFQPNIIVIKGNTVSNLTFKPNLIDLTQMFGSTIADYIYSLEQATAGAGVAWFKKLFPKDYYPYDEGTLLNVNPAGIKTVGFNAYDKATGKAELIGGNQYQITGTYTSLSYSTGEVLTPDSTGCFTPTKTGELTVTGGGENTCVHLTWSGYRNGDYEDYWTRTRDIDIQPYFPDGLKRAGAVYDEISKDKAIKRIGVVDLGSLDWQYRESGSPVSPYFYTTNVPDIKSPGALYTNPINAICSKYPVVIRTSSVFVDGTLCGDGTVTEVQQIQIKDSTYTDAASFKTAMSGVMLYYELATPVETPIDPPLNLLYQVSDFGTEQFLGAGATEPKTLPIIADIVYDVNYRDTIKNLPKNYAKVRGYYPDLYTGLADNLIDRKGNGTPQEISYRTSCGDDSIADDGNGIIQSIFGNTVVWNQLADSFELYGSGGTVEKSGNKYTYTFTELGTNQFHNAIRSSNQFNSVSGHKYLELFDVFCTKAFTISIGTISDNWTYAKVTANVKEQKGVIATGNGTKPYLYIGAGMNYDNTFAVGDTFEISNIQLIDLTQMFGAGNEPSTLDDPRIKWIKDYANEYPEYNIGELISYNGSGIKTVGFNQWNEEWVNGIWQQNGTISTSQNVSCKNPIKVFPNTTYYFHCGSYPTVGGYGVADVYLFDENMKFLGYYPPGGYLGKDTFEIKTTDKTRYITFTAYESTYGTTYKNDICINLSWSGYRNGEYEPYWSRTLNLPISTYFPDGMKSAGSVRDELTKDKAVKRIGVVDLGTLDYRLFSQSDTKDNFIIAGKIPIKPSANGNSVAPILSNIYVATSYNATWSSWQVSYANDNVSDNLIFITPHGTYTDAAAFKSAMSGVMLYYELAEPIETTITPPLDLTYKVADFGTEESIAEGKSTPFIGIIKYSDDFTRGLVNMPKNYDTTASLDALAASLSAMLTSALDGTVTITRGEYDPATKKYEWSCQFTKNQVN